MSILSFSISKFEIYPEDTEEELETRFVVLTYISQPQFLFNNPPKALITNEDHNFQIDLHDI